MSCESSSVPSSSSTDWLDVQFFLLSLKRTKSTKKESETVKWYTIDEQLVSFWRVLQMELEKSWRGKNRGARREEKKMMRKRDEDADEEAALTSLLTYE